MGDGLYLIWLMRWLRSYVVFSVRAGSLERLLNLCAREGIPVWDCRRENAAASGKTTVGGYRKMRRLMQEIGTSTRVTARGGMRFVLHRYRRRTGIVTGVALFAAFLIVSGQFVWNVRIEGCDTLTSPEQMTALLSDLGVHRGVLKRNIDLQSVARRVNISVNELSWAALNLHGTTAVLKLRERTPPPPKVDTNLPANVVAARDGQIVQLRVTDGKALRKQGDVVRAGEIIVSGVREDRWGVTHLMRANASVLAHVPETLTVEIPLAQEQAQPAGKVTRRRYLDLFGMRVPLFLYSEPQGTYKLERFSEPFYLCGCKMPVGIMNESFIFYYLTQTQIDEQTALQMAQKELLRKERQTFGDAKILTKQTNAICENGVLQLRADYQLEMEIAKQADIRLLERAREPKPAREGGY